MKTQIVILGLAGAFLILNSPVLAVERLVPSQYSTIQAAIDDCNNGDVVIVEPNVYTGTGNKNIDFLGKSITVRSIDPNDLNVAATTVIDCANSGRGFRFHSGEGPNSIVSGLTIKRGRVYSPGGGIYCEGASPTIKNCTISNNTARGDYGGYCEDGEWAYGGGIYGDSSSNPSIINCIITDNTARGGDGGGCLDEYAPNGGGGCGGGICIRGTGTIENCIIANNAAIGGYGGEYEPGPGFPPIYGSDGPSLGGGIYFDYQSNPIIRNCTITDNDEAGIYNFDSDYPITIVSSIIWGNNGDEVSGYGVFNITYSDIEGGYSGTGNIDADPCFIEPANDNYHLNPFSVCADAGDPNYSGDPCETDIDGEPRVMNGRVDMGADEVNIEAGVPVIEVSSTAFMFFAEFGRPNPEEQILSIRNKGTGTLIWEISEDCNWLSVEPNNGSSTGEFDDVNLSVDISGLPIGIYNYNLTVDANSSNSPETAAVQLHIGEDILHVPSEYGTIQEAIYAALNGSVIIVEPNVYTGSGNRDLDFGGLAITVRSTDPNDPNVVATTVIDCQNVNGHRGFYFHSGEEPNSIVLGLTIKRGRLYSNGGGIYCDGASPTIKNCTITDNRALNARGGGIYCTSSSHPAIINCTISNNTGRGLNGASGGDIGGDGSPGYGGGIYCSSDSSVTVINSIINNNTARGGNGGDGYYGPGWGGNAYGGGIYGSVTISNSIVSDNLAYSGEGGFPGEARGGGIYGGSVTVDNCLIVNNAADDAYGGNWWHYGGGIYASGGGVIIANCTIYNNTAYEAGGGVYCKDGGTIIDSIVWGNDDDLYNCSATYSCIEDGDAGEGNIDDDPCFVTGPLGDYYLSQIAAGQMVDSPCVDAGSDTAANLGMDIFTTRTDEVLDAGVVDMGYHYSAPIAADINRDWGVDLLDYTILASQWRQEPGIPSADIAPPGGDGRVDEKDLAVLVDNWLWEKQ